MYKEKMESLGLPAEDTFYENDDLILNQTDVDKMKDSE